MPTAGLTDAQLQAALRDPAAVLRELDRLDYEESFHKFVRRAWAEIDPAPFSDNWHIEAICAHLQAVAEGRFRKLLINIPPRHSKTLIVSVLFPAWIWAQRRVTELKGPQVKFMTLTYGDDFSLETATTARRLIEGEWYQSLWGDKVKITRDQSNKSKFDTTAGGTRISASFNASHLGRGADVRIIDDPIKVSEAESEPVRRKVNKTYDEALTSRVTDPAFTVTIIIMQRLHEEDLSGHVLSKDPEFVHLCLPARHDPERHCVTALPWEDPRTEDGELLWPDRFDDTTLTEWERSMGSYAAAGQLDQAPTPRGGGVIKREWWRMWPPEGEEHLWFKPAKDRTGKPLLDAEGKPKVLIKYPDMSYIIAVADTAFKEGQENDYSACVVLGLFMRNGLPKIILMEAWHDRLSFNALMKRIIKTCQKISVDALLVEDKASGQSIIQEIRRLMTSPEWRASGNDLMASMGGAPQGEVVSFPWQTIAIKAEGDKIARAHSTVAMFEDGMVYAPATEQFWPWAEDVIQECATLGRAAHDDLADAMIHGLRWLRRLNLATLENETKARDAEAVQLDAVRQVSNAALGDDVGGY